MPFTLIIARGAGEGRQHVSSRAVTTLGRTPENHVVLPEVGVSRGHARIVETGGRWFIEDLGSANGTLVNGERVPGRQELFSGDTVACGPVVLAFNGEPSAGHERPDSDLPLAEPQTVHREETEGRGALSARAGGDCGAGTVRELEVQLGRDRSAGGPRGGATRGTSGRAAESSGEARLDDRGELLQSMAVRAQHSGPGGLLRDVARGEAQPGTRRDGRAQGTRGRAPGARREVFGRAGFPPDDQTLARLAQGMAPILGPDGTLLEAMPLADVPRRAERQASAFLGDEALPPTAQARGQSSRPPELPRITVALPSVEGPLPDQALDGTQPDTARRPMSLPLAATGRSTGALSTATSGRLCTPGPEDLVFGGDEDRASDRARRRRRARTSFRAWAEYVWNESSTPVRTVGSALLGALIAAALFLGLRALGSQPPPAASEPELLSHHPLDASFGRGAGVQFSPVDAKRFAFQVTSPGGAVAVLHYQARNISEGEVAILVNGRELGMVPADTRAGRPLELVIPPVALRKNQTNDVVFENVRTPLGQEAWQVSRLWLEVLPVPELEPAALLRLAEDQAQGARSLQAKLGSEQLFKAWRGYRQAWASLVALPDGQRREFYREVKAALDNLAEQLDQQCGALMLDAKRAVELKNPERARAVLDEVVRYFPTADHRCHNLALEKRSEYAP